jgi:Lon protease-like protein
MIALPKYIIYMYICIYNLGGAFYPAGRKALMVFEMKYRTMMFDCAKADDTFGYIHTDEYGRIGSIGTMCKITDRHLSEDGRQEIAFQGTQRFRVTKILKTLPYVLAEIETVEDGAIDDDIAATKLELEVYDALKYYMRLMRSYTPNKTLVVSQSAKTSRPLLAGTMSDYSTRRTDFSFALANMIQMSRATESQLLLQTTDTIKRLAAEKEILTQASELISDQLISMEMLTADVRDSLKFQSFNSADDDDILPPDYIEDGEVKDLCIHLYTHM